MRKDHKRLLVVAPLLFVLSFVMMMSSSCAQKEGDEPTKYQSQAGLEKLTQQAAKKSATNIGIVASNPKFSSVKNIIPSTPTSKDIDSIIRPVLIKMFKEAKLILAKGPEAPKMDGEVVEDRLVYSVKSFLTESDGETLHDGFHAVGFVDSPRLGRKPTHSRGNVYMSLMKSTSQRGYSFVMVVDTGKQQVEIESYKLGSKYDRM